jgi:beta-1,4-mannosyl-glycoprotein beta-1,4-N-acetylglucosaminyltransferase
MKLVDCFSFYNELTLLEYRLNLLDPVVDTFIIAEANQTHMGHPKELYSRRADALFKKFQHKIIHVVLDLPYTHDVLNVEKEQQWDNEQYQRNALQRGILSLYLDDNDCILISDLDEIPDPETLAQIKSGLIPVTLNSFEQDFYYYNLQSKFVTSWNSSRILSYQTFSELGISCTAIRLSPDAISINRGGWHLSYFGDAEFIKNKLQNFAHAEHNTEKTVDETNIKWHIDNTKCLVGHSFAMVRLPIAENPYLPPQHMKYLKQFI